MGHSTFKESCKTSSTNVPPFVDPNVKESFDNPLYKLQLCNKVKILALHWSSLLKKKASCINCPPPPPPPSLSLSAPPKFKLSLPLPLYIYISLSLYVCFLFLLFLLLLSHSQSIFRYLSISLSLARAFSLSLPMNLYPFIIDSKRALTTGVFVAL